MLSSIQTVLTSWKEGLGPGYGLFAPEAARLWGVVALLSRGHEQDGAADVGVQLGGLVIPEGLNYPEVVLSAESGGYRSVFEGIEVGENYVFDVGVVHCDASRAKPRAE